MATSGTRAFTPQFADILSEAFSRVQIRPENVTPEHIEEAIRSANLLLVELAGDGIQQFQLVEQIVTLVEADPTYDLPAGTIDVWYGTVRKGNQDTPIWPISRDDYASIPDKTNIGRPFNYFVETGTVGETARTITFWPVPGTANATTARLWVWRRAEVITAMAQNPGVAWEFLDCYSAGLAKRLAVKFAPQLAEARAAEFDMALLKAKRLGRSRAPLRLRATGYLRRGRII